MGVELNCAFYYGIGQNEERWEDDYFKIKIMKNLPRNWNLFLFSRLKKGKELAPQGTEVSYIYDEENFDSPESDEQIKKEENWLDYPIRTILSQDKAIRVIKDEEKIRYHAGIAAKYIRRWRNLFEKNKTEIFCSSYECALCERTGILVANRLGIPAIIISLARVRGGTVFYDGDLKPFYWKQTTKDEEIVLYKNYQKKLKDRSGVEFEQLKKTIDKSIRPSTKKIGKFLNFTNRYSRMKEYEKTRYRRSTSAVSRYFKIFFRRLIATRYYQQADFNEKYFLYPLQYEEEAQQLVRDLFLNQFEIIERISKILPFGVFLYVKPHPHQQASEASGRGLVRVAKLSNVKIIYPHTNTTKLIENSRGLITINSTMGFEAITLGKPIITFGHDWYAHKDVAVIIRDFQDLNKIIINIMDDPEKFVNKDKIIEFVGGYLKQSIPAGSLDGTYMSLTDAEAKVVADEFVKFVESGEYKKGAGK